MENQLFVHRDDVRELRDASYWGGVVSGVVGLLLIEIFLYVFIFG